MVQINLNYEYCDLARHLPRFSQWRRDYGHTISCWRCPDEWATRLPTALFDNTVVSVQVFESESGTGRASLTARTRLLLAEQTDVVLQRSEPAWPVKSLGL